MGKLMTVITLMCIINGILAAGGEKNQTKITLTKLGGRSYYFEFSKGLNWTSAQQFCRSHGLQLASIETEEENNLIAEYILRNAPRPGWVMWLGGSDKEVEGTWRWRNGQKFTFSDWGEGQPSTHKDWRGSADCLSMRLSSDGDHFWAATLCKYAFLFVCEQ